MVRRATVAETVASGKRTCLWITRSPDRSCGAGALQSFVFRYGHVYDRACKERCPLPGPASPTRSPWRTPAAIALALAALAVVLLLRGGGGHRYEIDFANAGQLVKGDLVRIGGTNAGSVDSIGVTADGQAEVHVTVDDAFGPLREGSNATIRAQGLIGVASRYIDISPAPSFRPALADGATIGTDHTTSIVEVDQLFDTFTPRTRKGLERLVKGFASWYQGRARQANLSAQYFAPALSATARLFSEIDRDSATLQQFLVQTGDALGGLQDRSAQLTDLVSHARATARALGADNRSLSLALQQLPPALREGSSAFAALRPALGDLGRLVDATGPATRNLAAFLHRLAPVVAEAAPTFKQFRALFDQPGPGNDLYDALVDLPPLARLTTRTLPHAEQALTQSTAVFAFARPYVPDLVSWTRSFGGAMAPYDANGHYARTEPVFDAFSLDASGKLVPKPPAQRGQSPVLRTGLLRRCPGAGALIPDGSAPFVDNGPLANPDCDPTQAVGR
jgi:phospholipid/cholesterol/gamma-HCH transport system substrate-binding protein